MRKRRSVRQTIAIGLMPTDCLDSWQAPGVRGVVANGKERANLFRSRLFTRIHDEYESGPSGLHSRRIFFIDWRCLFLLELQQGSAKQFKFLW